MIGHAKRLALIVCLSLAVVSSVDARPTIDSDITVRSAAILTTSYVGSTSLSMPYSNQLLCYVDVTLGSLTTIEAKAQYSYNDSTWFDEAERQTSTVTAAVGIDQAIGLVYPKIYQLNDTATIVIATPNLGRYMRIAIKGTGTTTSSSATVRCVTGAI